MIVSCRRGFVRGFRASSCAGLLLLSACGGGSGDGSSQSSAALSPAAQLGKTVFFDTALSVSGQQSCGSCHVPARAFSADDGLAVPLGGPDMDLQGLRNAPSLMYASFTPAFFFAADGTPTGGFMRDGRELSLASQAQGPFVTAFEMANSGPDEVLERLKTRPYLQQFTDIYGAAALKDAKTALADLGAALAAFETEDSAFHPFSSKYDYFQKGQAQLTPQEQNGLVLFNDPTHGNCAACHPATSADGSLPPLFTDFTYDMFGVPRNAAIAANNDAATLSYVPYNSTDGVHRYYDMGLCGPLRSDLGGNVSGFCGAFKVPTLRNVALTAPYFHNGEFSTLQDVVSFYVTRDTRPDQWYGADAEGNVTKFDDLQAAYGGLFTININVPGSDANYFGNINTVEIPYNRVMGQAPALSPEQIDEVIAFLCTLTDGYDPANPQAYTQSLPAQCPQAAGGS